ncbi:MAG TPA: tol-pal system protein YbgF [Burkholderiaceae bacterium]|nr:tol-pal system protein YbgF [Burkholderiaceae bacterium]HQR72752.1 tol-pal system protein YbgF [Burkholderiaceae bacterium]
MNHRILATAFALALSLPVHAQLFADDDARKAILELRQRINAMQSELTARLDTAQRNQLEMANQNETLRQEIARLRGQVESLTNEVATLQKRNRDLYTDLDARLKKFEPSTVTIDGKSASVERSEQAAYDAALTQFRSGDFKGSIGSFQQFLARYPSSAYAPAAWYFIGSAQFAQKDYKASIASNQVIVDRYKDSPRAPEALLSIADSQLQTADKRGANRTLTRVIQEYPNSEAAVMARERLPSTR